MNYPLSVQGSAVDQIAGPHRHRFAGLLFILLAPLGLYSQTPWSGILLPASTCHPLSTATPGQCAIDWTTVGIAGGIPSASWLQSGSTILASTYGNGTTDASSGINSALTTCGSGFSGNPASGKYVLLGAGTFLIDSTVTVPGGCELRGSGANQTILNSMTTGTASAVRIGSGGSPKFSGAVTVTSASAGSTTITVTSVTGVSVGTLLLIDQINDGTIVSVQSDQGSTCTWCDGGQTANGSRAQGQIDKVTAISGTGPYTLTLDQPLFVTYSATPNATPFTAALYAGASNLQVYANNTHSSNNGQNFWINECAYCWISGVEGNYTDGDHVDADWSYRGEIINSYFSNAYLHTSGQTDSDVDVRNKSTGFLVQNNIMERLHTSIMLEWGVAGNVIAYNYSFGNFDSGTPNFAIQDIAFHGAHPQFNLFEGNQSDNLGQDDIWGSEANNTAFRNWVLGTSLVCNPLTGRSTVSCTGANGHLADQANRAMDLNFLNTNYNMIGNIEGSSDENSLGTGVAIAVAVCGSSPCGSGSRAYQGKYYNETFGYGSSGDTGGSTYNSIIPYNTALVHGEYSRIANAIYWSGSMTHTLPASFYLSSKPAWFGSVPWPAIGPDVSGGESDSNGYAYAIPARVCYENVTGGTNGAGSPLSFNATACYGGTSSNPAPAAPASVSALIH